MYWKWNFRHWNDRLKPGDRISRAPTLCVLSMAVIGNSVHHQVERSGDDEMCSHRSELTAIAHGAVTRCNAIINFIMCIKCNYMHTTTHKKKKKKNAGRSWTEGKIELNWKLETFRFWKFCTKIKWYVISWPERREWHRSKLRITAATVVHLTTQPTITTCGKAIGICIFYKMFLV